MAPMAYDEAAAERLEAIYRGHDVVAQRAETLRRLALQPGERVLDIGSGPGFLCQEMAEQVGPSGQVRGIDLSAEQIARASARNTCARVSYAEGDAVALDEPDAGYDAIVSTQVAEYVPDIARFCAEAFRVLRPGGRGLILATDWDAVVWHTTDPARMRRILKAFEPHCADPGLPRTLAPRLRQAGFEVTDVSGFPIVNTDRDPGNYSAGMMDFVARYVDGRGSVPEAEVRGWQQEQVDLARSGGYFFLTTRVMFEVERPA